MTPSETTESDSVLEIKSKFDEINALTFEEALSRLDGLVSKIQDENIGIEKSFELWEEGQALHKHCQERLDEISRRIEEDSA